MLVLGTSHVGKSTCARGIGNAIGWPVIPTDKLGRHPGRPWTSVPDPVTEFYLRLTDDAIHWFLRVHHENMRPVIHETIKAAREAGGGFIFEGAALRPNTSPIGRLARLWLFVFTLNAMHCGNASKEKAPILNKAIR